MTTHARRGARATATVGAATLALTLGLAAPSAALGAPAPTSAASTSAGAALAQTDATPGALTNLDHLDFLLDVATPPQPVEGHTTYRLAEEPDLVMPWTYADARDGGTFERIGGGPLDLETGDWEQGAYNADDVTRTAIVYIRHWQQTGDPESKQKAYELLRSTAYLQVTDGENAGNVVLWMQPDGELNRSAEPIELPDPSDTGASYWLARTVWALGEGYAAFRDEDPEFAAFLEDRLALSLDAVERQVLSRYGEWEYADGVRVPAWLIVNGADASAEAVLGLAARVEAAPDDTRAADAMRKLSEGIAALSAGDTNSWPYGALMPWAESPSMWHGWASQMPAALAVASIALGDPSIAAPAVKDAASFTPTLLTAGGADNGWFPSPTDRVQIAYGVDSRVQSLLAVADVTGHDSFDRLAAMQASWYFGANHAGALMYDPATGVTYDGLQPDGTVNRNSGAESTIHGLLTMLALDAHPQVAGTALSLTSVASRDGLELVEAEDAARTNGTVISPESWTGESSWSGDALRLERGQHAVFDIGTDATRRWVEPVVFTDPGARSTSTWRTGALPTGVLDLKGADQGISPAPGSLLPRSLQLPVLGSRAEFRVDVLRGSLTVDALLVRPVVSELTLTGGSTLQLVHSSAAVAQRVQVGSAGTSTAVTVYDRDGAQVRSATVEGARSVLVPAGGFALAQR